MITQTVTAPLRICLAGEQLDWLGGLSACVAVDQSTKIEIGPRTTSDTNIELGEYRALFADLANLVSHPDENFNVSCQLLSNPHAGVGLASSSAIAIAISYALHRATGKSHEASQIAAAETAYSAEYKIGRGGGMDHQSIVSGGYVLTEGRDGELSPVLSRRAPEPGDLHYLLVDSSIPKRSDSVIAEIRAAHAQGDPAVTRYIDRGTTVASEIWRALTIGDHQTVFTAINEAHAELSTLPGVTSPPMERLRRDALAFGLPAVKICGSGGGGYFIAPVEPAEASTTLAAFRSAFPTLRAHLVSPASNGVRYVE
jgi:mevalonate kinase